MRLDEMALEYRALRADLDRIDDWMSLATLYATACPLWLAEWSRHRLAQPAIWSPRLRC